MGFAALKVGRIKLESCFLLGNKCVRTANVKSEDAKRMYMIKGSHYADFEDINAFFDR